MPIKLRTNCKSEKLADSTSDNYLKQATLHSIKLICITSILLSCLVRTKYIN